MPTHILRAIRDPEIGDLGLVCVGLPDMDGKPVVDLDGTGIAHDLIEHVNGLSAIGGVGDELEALGAMWYTRGQHGDLWGDRRESRYSAEENIAADVERMARDYNYYPEFGRPIPRTRSSMYDEAFQKIISLAKRDVDAEINSEDIDLVHLNRYFSEAIHFLRAGYGKAVRKYERRGRFYANNRFWEIADAVRPFAKRCDFEGQEFKLTYDCNGARCIEREGDY